MHKWVWSLVEWPGTPIDSRPSRRLARSGRAAQTLVRIGDEARDYLIMIQETTTAPVGKIVEELLANWDEIAKEQSSGQDDRIEAWPENVPSEGEARIYPSSI